MSVSSLREFLQSLSTQSVRKVHVIRGKEAEPLELFSEFRLMGRRVQFVSLDDLPDNVEAHMIDAMDRYRASGCDIVFLVSKKEHLAHFGPLFREWEQAQESLAPIAGAGAVILCLSGEAALDSSYGEAELDIPKRHISYGTS